MSSFCFFFFDFSIGLSDLSLLLYVSVFVYLSLCLNSANINANHLLMRNQQNTKNSNIYNSRKQLVASLYLFLLFMFACVRVCGYPIAYHYVHNYHCALFSFFSLSGLIFLSFYSILIVKLQRTIRTWTTTKLYVSLFF